MTRLLSPALLLALVGCVPQNAELTGGTYTSFMSVSTSKTVADGDVDYADAEKHYIVDCRDEPIVGADQAICDDSSWPPEHEAWLERDGFQVVQEALDPWRGEAVITSEGDLQLTFHQRLPGGSDFRFAFLVDPAFAPKRCVETESGVALEDIDGADWLTEWSAETDGLLFYLNSGAYQFNPDDTEQIWSLPQEWRAGYGQAKFAAEDYGLRSTRYGMPLAYSSFELEEDASGIDADLLFYADVNEGDGVDAPAYRQQINRVTRVIEQSNEEYAMVKIPESFTPVQQNNGWRPTDGRPPGLDAWVGLQYNYVHFDAGSELEIGGSASGEFNLLFAAFDSQSHIFISGTFEIPRIKRDRWVTSDVSAAKFEENNTTLCGITAGDMEN